MSNIIEKINSLTDEQLQQVLDLINSFNNTTTCSKKQQTNRKTKAESTKISVRHNKFEDMPEFHQHKEDTRIDKILNKNCKVSQRREPVQKVDVICEGCNKTFKVSPLLVPPRDSVYKCNKCAK